MRFQIWEINHQINFDIELIRNRYQIKGRCELGCESQVLMYKLKFNVSNQLLRSDSLRYQHIDRIWLNPSNSIQYQQQTIHWKKMNWQWNCKLKSSKYLILDLQPPQEKDSIMDLAFVVLETSYVQLCKSKGSSKILKESFNDIEMSQRRL